MRVVLNTVLVNGRLVVVSVVNFYGEIMKLKIESTTNGYIVQIVDTIKNNGTYVYRGVDILQMLEFIGEAVLTKKVTVTER